MKTATVYCYGMNPENVDRSASPESGPCDGGAFPATAWSMLHQVQGGNDSESLAGWERLARAYWQPLYSFLRRRGVDHHSAADDIQGFFAHMLSREFFQRIERGDGLFRTFLLTALQRWRIDQHRAATAQKRGSGIAPLSLEELEGARAEPVAGGATPEEAFDRRWARTLYDNALGTLHGRLKARGREEQFLNLRGILTGQDTAKYADIATALNMSEGAVKQAALEMRREFGSVLRDEIRRTVADEAQIDGEIRYLLGLLRS